VNFCLDLGFKILSIPCDSINQKNLDVTHTDDTEYFKIFSHESFGEDMLQEYLNKRNNNIRIF